MAACVWEGKYVAVGEDIGGFFFLPPWNLWQQWAKDALARNRHDRRLTRSVDVWINGKQYSPRHRLP